MRAGDLNRRVRIERRDQSQDDLGQPVDTWVEVATVWGNVRMLTGKETLTADADVASATASIRIRYRTNIDNSMRAVVLKFVDGQPVEDVIFNILAPLPNLASREYTDLACSAFTNNG
ncbi:phage head-tail adaptor, putative, SPP1 family [Paraburkholderia fungorum]|uniref:Phage head-tail adaptor, putative, SPP1 family n=1 Tax=Paraburkholderia fungorum TaxID=134537 RepID=A0A1H1H0W4_9BURK|nr:phage head closure protein [Paraburkholderia fungorum]SDR19060.1 phage head-tail adaptor, putative, SPP1 family [Paraburkholderia fungorum]